MRRRLLLASVLVGACGLFPDLSGLSDSDAGLDVSSPDVTLDSPSESDAAPETSTDAGSDASDASDAGWCTLHAGHTFCEDFDEPGFTTRWTGVSTSGITGMVIESDASFISPPNSMLATIGYAAGSGSAFAYAYVHFASASTITIQVQLLVNPVGMPQLDPLVIDFTPPPSGYTHYDIHIDVGDNHLGNNYTPSDGGPTVNVDTTFNNPFTVWRNLEVNFDLTTAKVALLVDSVPTVSWTVAPLTPSSFDLRLGVVAGTAGTTATTATVHVDNVLVDTTM